MRPRVHPLPIDGANVQALFSYADGRLFWKARTSPYHRMKAGDAAGTVNGNYRIIRYRGVGMYEHRLVWLFHHGQWPSDEIDHINGDGLDNRIENLRVVSRYENAQNVKDLNSNKLGMRGVCYIRSRNKYRATIRANGTCKTLGLFQTAEDAQAAYLTARALLHPKHSHRPAEGASS